MVKPLLSLLVSAALLAACEAPVTSPASEETETAPEPMDFVALRDAYLAANPDAESLPLRRRSKGGFFIAKDGSATYRAFGAITDLRMQTRVTSVEGNSVCLAAVESWSGVCLDLFRTPSGEVLVEYEFGNGRGGTYTARNLSL